MLNAIYTPLSGAIAQERVLEVIANNLANISTTAFKGENVAFTLLEPEPYKNYKNPLPPANYKVSFEDLMPLKGNELSYVGVAEIQRDQTQGPAIKTNNQTDLLIEGAGYFVVNTTEGERFTRDGALKLSGDGVLSTQSGQALLGEKGTINLRSGAFSVNNRGEIYQDGQLVDRLLVYNLPEAALERAGNNLFIYGGPAEGKQRLEHPAISQGMIEGSNVNAMKNLTAMIFAHRSYEAYQKAVSNFDRMMEKSSNSIGEVRV